MNKQFTFHENNSATLLELKEIASNSFSCHRCGSEVIQNLSNPLGWSCTKCTSAYYLRPLFEK